MGKASQHRTRINSILRLGGRLCCCPAQARRRARDCGAPLCFWMRQFLSLCCVPWGSLPVRMASRSRLVPGAGAAGRALPLRCCSLAPTWMAGGWGLGFGLGGWWGWGGGESASTGLGWGTTARSVAAQRRTARWRNAGTRLAGHRLRAARWGTQPAVHNHRAPSLECPGLRVPPTVKVKHCMCPPAAGCPLPGAPGRC